MSGTALSAQELQRIAASAGWRQRRIEVFDTAQGKVLAKGQRPPRRPALYRLLGALAWITGAPFLKAAPMHGGARAQQTEVARLRALHAAGARVPQVLHVAPDHFVMEWLGGEHLGTLLQAGHPQGEALWREAGDLLVRLHARGQYLSQGFARNLIVDARGEPPRLAGAIDFEDDPLDVMRLPEAQVRDWLAFLQSTLWTLPLPPERIDAQLDSWMRLEADEVRDQFLAAAGKLRWLRHLPRQRRFGRDTVALQAAAAAVHRFAVRHGARRAPRASS
jgi:tRNA A-37 threonylcarbamoyl transferase component Bud32